MSMAPEGAPFVIVSTVVGVLMGIILVRLLSAPTAVGVGAALIPAAFVAFFFRDPRRHTSADPDVVLSPADGRVTDIVQVDEPTLGGPATRIGIFLSVFNVHVQRAPTPGQVVRREHRPGIFKPAWSTDIGGENEHTILEIATDAGVIMVRQIAGLIARRIVTDPSVGDSLMRGERIGLIRFGSRVELTVPPDWTIQCRPGDRVSAALTPVARKPGATRTETGGVA